MLSMRVILLLQALRVLNCAIAIRALLRIPLETAGHFMNLYLDVLRSLLQDIYIDDG